MSIEQLFNAYADQEVARRRTEQSEYNHRISLRREWIEGIYKDMLFLVHRGFKVDYHSCVSEPYIHITAPRGFGFVDISSKHIWDDEDTKAGTFYVYSNNSSFPLKQRISMEQVIKVISAWI